MRELTKHLRSSFQQGGSRMGHGSSRAVPDPILLPAFDSLNLMVRHLENKYQHTVILDENFHVWTVGYNGYGQLGVFHELAGCDQLGLCV